METPVEPSERGRYAIYEEPDGGLVIPRTTDLCDTCAACGCGTQAEPLRVPSAIVRMAKMASEGNGGLAERIKHMKGLMKL